MKTISMDEIIEQFSLCSPCWDIHNHPVVSEQQKLALQHFKCVFQQVKQFVVIDFFGV